MKPDTAHALAEMALSRGFNILTLWMLAYCGSLADEDGRDAVCDAFAAMGAYIAGATESLTG